MRFSTALMLTALVVLVSAAPTPKGTVNHENKHHQPSYSSDGTDCSTKHAKCAPTSYCAIFDTNGFMKKKRVCTKKHATGEACIFHQGMCAAGNFCKRDKPDDKKDLKGKCTLQEVKKPATTTAPVQVPKKEDVVPKTTATVTTPVQTPTVDTIPVTTVEKQPNPVGETAPTGGAPAAH